MIIIFTSGFAFNKECIKTTIFVQNPFNVQSENLTNYSTKPQ